MPEFCVYYSSDLNCENPIKIFSSFSAAYNFMSSSKDNLMLVVKHPFSRPIGVYLCARKHRIPGYNIFYNDIVEYDGIDIPCDMRKVLLDDFDYIIATPSCNYYSRANYRRETSIVAQETNDLLPYILDKCSKLDKPFLIENVCNSSLLPRSDFYEFDFGNHHFYTNVFMFVPDKSWSKKQNKQNVCRNKRDGNYNVDLIIRLFLETINA